MVEQHLCSFCGEQIEPGTGKMYVRKDGTTLLYCTNKCYKNMVELKRVPRNVTWTKAYATKKGITMAAKEKSEAKVEERVRGCSRGQGREEGRAQGEDRDQEEGQGRQEG